MCERGRVEPSPKRVRVMLGAETVADSARPLLVWEKPYYPTYYFPEADVRTDLLTATGETRNSSTRGEARVFDVMTGEREAKGAAASYPESPLEEIRNHFVFDWQSMDHWFEEEEEVYVHPRDPYKRIDVLRSARHVRIDVDGTTVAESRNPTLLFETSLPVRYYLPKTGVRWDLLRPSETRTECPYKGTAEYWSVEVDGKTHEDVVWTYPFPTLEAAKIAGLMCFYDEKVAVFVDGEFQSRPETPFS